jgi:hypothetical protein
MDWLATLGPQPTRAALLARSNFFRTRQSPAAIHSVTQTRSYVYSLIQIKSEYMFIAKLVLLEKGVSCPAVAG